MNASSGTKPNTDTISKYLGIFASNMQEANADGSFMEYVIAMAIVVAQLHKTTAIDEAEAIMNLLKETPKGSVH